MVARSALLTGMCQIKVLALAKEHGVQGFKVSQGGIVRFITGKNLCSRKRSSISHWLPDTYEEKVLCFQKCYQFFAAAELIRHPFTFKHPLMWQQAISMRRVLW
jgi:hypothetical protein